MNTLVLFGSSSDTHVYEKIVDTLPRATMKVCSAHRTPEMVQQLLQGDYDFFVAGAGLAAHLPGVIAAHTIKPTFGVPVESNFDGLDSLLAILQMPPGIPVLATGVNAGTEATAFIKTLTKKHRVNIINRAGTVAQKAVRKCTSTLDELDVLYVETDEEQEDAVNVVMIAIHDPTPEPVHTTIYVPIQEKQRANDALHLLDLTKRGVWVGMNRGENAAIAAVQLMNTGGTYTKSLMRHRKKQQHKIYAANKQQTTTYAHAGVDIAIGNQAVEQIKQHVQATFTPSVLTDVGLFGGLYQVDTNNVLVASTDGVGTKVKIASEANTYDTIGQDLVNHCANDILAQGATPLFFLDYIATAKIQPRTIAEIVKGLSVGCRENGCSLIGGETAEMPGVYNPGKHDIVGCIVGMVERDAVIDGKTIQEGDTIIGLPSAGLHTNGYSLAIKVLLEEGGMFLNDELPNGETLKEALLAVHKSYVAPIKRLLPYGLIKGMAHITGGGLTENIPRVLPEGLGAAINTNSWTPQEIFTLIQEKGNVPQEEMYRVFNMGIGFVLITNKPEVVLKELSKEKPVVVGSIIKGKGVQYTMATDQKLQEQLNNVLEETNFPALGTKHEGKVRDSYVNENQRIIVTTDRVSAFDRVLGSIPFKGQVLNQMAMFWFDKTTDIVKNHLVGVPDPNVTISKECEALPVEAVVRAYNTGSTTTSVWHHYKQGGREFCGNTLPDGMKKDEKFPKPIFTPSTKAEKGDHDESVSKEEIVRRGLLSKEMIDKIEEVSMKLFQRGSKIVAEQGIILVDTKYEFGLLNGELVLIDEIHTPDSSRFWYADTYEERLARGEEQRKIDKEYLRTWLADRGFVGEGPIPEIPDSVKVEAAKRYITAYELITGEPFHATPGNPTERIRTNLKNAGYSA